MFTGVQMTCPKLLHVIQLPRFLTCNQTFKYREGGYDRRFPRFLASASNKGYWPFPRCRTRARWWSISVASDASELCDCVLVGVNGSLNPRRKYTGQNDMRVFRVEGVTIFETLKKYYVHVAKDNKPALNLRAIMERNHRRKTSGETRFELNAILSTFKYSRAIFFNKKQQQQVLAGRSPKQAFFPYNQDAGFKEFDSNTASEVPPVHELFAGFIGPYQYYIPPNTQDCDALISRTLSQTFTEEQSLTSPTPERQPLRHENSINSKAVNSKSGSKKCKWLLVNDMNEIETVFVERDKFWSGGACEVPEKTLFI